MHRVDSPLTAAMREKVSTSPARRKGVLVVAVAAAAVTALSACTAANDNQSGPTPSTSGSTHTSTGSPVTGGSSPAAPSTSSSPAPVLAAKLTTIPAPGSKDVNPGKPFTVTVKHGQLVKVVMRNPEGERVTGAIAGSGTSWHTTEALGYSKTYKVMSVAKESDGTKVVRRTRITTLTPGNMTMPYLQRIGGYPLGNNATYGVGIVPVVHFDEPITNKAAAEKAIHIETSPHVAGAWYWSDDQNAHWRPQHYWPSGTKVTVDAHVYGVELGKGLYGESDVKSSFTIGRKQVVIADDNAPNAVNKVRVYRNGQLIHTMNTSMGEHTGTYVNGNYINFYTLDGTYTVLDHENPASMCSASYGLPANAPGGYACEDIYWATKISTDGIYLHELDTTVWDQDHGYDVSHGCLNLNHDNAEWYFKHSMVGDPVVVHGAKGAPTLQVWEGGDWTVPWKTWVKGGTK